MIKKAKRTRSSFRIIEGVKHYSSCAAAKKLGICKSTLLSYSRETKKRRARITNYKMGKYYYYSQEALDDFLKECKTFGFAGG